MIVAVVHYLNGAIRLQPMGERITQNAAQLSVLLALAALVKAADYALQRFRADLRAGQLVRRRGYTAVNARIPATEFLILDLGVRRRAVHREHLAAGLDHARHRRGPVGAGRPDRRVGLPGVRAALPGVAGRALQGAAVHHPQHRRDAEALGLGDVTEGAFDYQKTVTPGAIEAQRTNLADARLLDPAGIQPTVQELEFEREFYRFDDIDVDRYVVEAADGQTPAPDRVPVIVSARELNAAGIKDATWEKLHLIFTHGYGLALAPANSTNSRGEPDFLVWGSRPRPRPPGAEAARDLPR